MSTDQQQNEYGKYKTELIERILNDYLSLYHYAKNNNHPDELILADIISKQATFKINKLDVKRKLGYSLAKIKIYEEEMRDNLRAASEIFASAYFSNGKSLSDVETISLTFNEIQGNQADLNVHLIKFNNPPNKSTLH